jgi:hypothetical protein
LPTPHRATVPLEKISAGVPPVEGKNVEDDKDRLEERALSNRAARAQIGSVEQSNRDKRVNRKLRWRYAGWVFCYLVSYSIAVLLLLLLSGLGYIYIPDIVLSALVGSTAVSAIGLVGFVVNGLFRPH